MYPPLRQAEWIKFIGLLITSENFCTLKIQKKFGDAFYPRTLTHWLKPLIHHSYRCEGKSESRVRVNSYSVSVSAMPSPPSKKIEVASPLYVSILLLFSFHLSGNKFLYTFMSVFGGSFAALLITSVIYSKVFIPCILHEQASE